MDILSHVGETHHSNFQELPKNKQGVRTWKESSAISVKKSLKKVDYDSSKMVTLI